MGLVWVDGGYVNTIDAGLNSWADHHEGIEIVVAPRNADVKDFQVLPRRWVAERTFGWLTRCRRLARDYERRGDLVVAVLGGGGDVAEGWCSDLRFA